MGNWWLTALSGQCSHSRITSNEESFEKHQITQVTQPHYSPDLVPCDFWLFPKLKSPLKWKRFQTIHEFLKNTTGRLMAIGRIVWGPKVPTLKGTEASLSYVQFLVCCIIFNKCLYFSYYVAGYSPDGLCIYVWDILWRKRWLTHCNIDGDWSRMTLTFKPGLIENGGNYWSSWTRAREPRLGAAENASEGFPQL